MQLASVSGTASLCPVILPTKDWSNELNGVAVSLAASWIFLRAWMQLAMRLAIVAGAMDCPGFVAV